MLESDIMFDKNRMYEMGYAIKVYSIALLYLGLSIACSAKAEQSVAVEISDSEIQVIAHGSFDNLSIQITGTQGYGFQKSYENTQITLPISELNLVNDGYYHYEATGIKFTGETRVVNGNGREPGALMRASIVKRKSGRFQVVNSSIVVLNPEEESGEEK
jgi:hypothetical protein